MDAPRDGPFRQGAHQEYSAHLRQRHRFSWRKAPGNLPIDERGMRRTKERGGPSEQRFIKYSQKIIRALAGSLGNTRSWSRGKSIMASGHSTEASFNDETKRDWHVAEKNRNVER
jgi:hypothetical protein